MRSDIEFQGHGGTVLRGWLYMPERSDERPLAAVAMAHGFSAVKEMALDEYAEVFCEAGLAVLVYDHRNLGTSDGDPRQEINPWAQARDYRHAISWLAERPEIDERRIGIWGSSYSGGEVIVVGACDERVKAVVANVPFAGYAGIDYSDTESGFTAIRDALEDAKGEGPADVRSAEFGPMLVVRDARSDEAPMLDQSESHEWFTGYGEKAPNWVNNVTLVNGMGTDPTWDPGVCIAHVAPRPLLLIVATEDRLAATDVSLEAFERAGEPKELVMIGGHHFVPYAGEGFEQSSSAARAFFVRRLGVGARS